MSKIITRVSKPYRFIPVSKYYSYLKKALKEAGGMAVNKKRGYIDKQFAERIFLAVTSVNGCRYCSFYHAKLALTSGLEMNLIRDLLAGDLGAVPEDEVIALVYAQHYADTEGKPVAEAVDKLLANYGEERARVIQTHINMITVGNFYGTAFDGLQSRFKLKPIEGSRPGTELGIVFGSLLLFPVALVDLLFSGVFGNTDPEKQGDQIRQPFHI